MDGLVRRRPGCAKLVPVRNDPGRPQHATFGQHVRRNLRDTVAVDLTWTLVMGALLVVPIVVGGLLDGAAGAIIGFFIGIVLMFVARVALGLALAAGVAWTGAKLVKESRKRP